jgi:plasmid maintenance system antidote protein VapI
MEERRWSQVDLADRTGFSKKHINELVKGRASIAPDTAERLSTVLGGTSQFWLNREANYRAQLERQRVLKAHSQHFEWLNELPVSWMAKRGLLQARQSKAERVDALLRWFGVASVDAWRTTYEAPLVAFRAAGDMKRQVGNLAVWLRTAELQADQIACEAFDLQAFTTALQSARELVAEPNPKIFVPKLRSLLATSGVLLTFTPAPPGCPVHGVTRWLTPDRALLGLSLRYLTDDQLWFSFFHEAAHIAKHRKRQMFVEGLAGLDADLEAEADRFAADVLIPPTDAQRLGALTTAQRVKAFARSLGISAGVVVGRLQHDHLIKYSELNHLKVRYEWTDNDHC